QTSLRQARRRRRARLGENQEDRAEEQAPDRQYRHGDRNRGGQQTDDHGNQEQRDKARATGFGQRSRGELLPGRVAFGRHAPLSAASAPPLSRAAHLAAAESTP